MAATIRDVADLAGTSVSAVSAVISVNRNHNIRVGIKTRARILEAAEQLGYRPNPLAKSLVTGKTGVLGLRCFPTRKPLQMETHSPQAIMSGVFEEVVRERYNVMLHTSVGNEWSLDDRNLQMDPRVDGMLFVIPPIRGGIIDRCRKARFPYVALVADVADADVYAVNADDLRGGRIAVEHLVKSGHRRIAHLVGDPKVATTELRRRGYLSAMEEAGIPFEEASDCGKPGFTLSNGPRSNVKGLP